MRHNDDFSERNYSSDDNWRFARILEGISFFAQKFWKLSVFLRYASCHTLCCKSRIASAKVRYFTCSRYRKFTEIGKWISEGKIGKDIRIFTSKLLNLLDSTGNREYFRHRKNNVGTRVEQAFSKIILFVFILSKHRLYCRIIRQILNWNFFSQTFSSFWLYFRQTCI